MEALSGDRMDIILSGLSKGVSCNYEESFLSLLTLYLNENHESVKVTPTAFVQSLKVHLPLDHRENWLSALSSTIWMIGTQASLTSPPAPKVSNDTPGSIEPSPSDLKDQQIHKLYIALIKELIGQHLVDVTTLKNSLELSTLADLMLIRDDGGEAHQKRLVKINTGIVYKQQKYNLLREETEGYAKLVIDTQVLGDALHAGSEITGHVQRAIQSIFMTIGCFDLEPNRVCDLLLDAYEQHMLLEGAAEEQKERVIHAYRSIFQQFRLSNLVHLLGFKLSNYRHTSLQPAADPPMSPKAAAAPASSALPASSTAAPVPSLSTVNKYPLPTSLLRLAVHLVSYELIDLEVLLVYLQPSLQETAQWLAAQEEQTRKLLAKLSQGGNPLNDLSTTATVGTVGIPLEFLRKLFIAHKLGHKLSSSSAAATANGAGTTTATATSAAVAANGAAGNNKPPPPTYPPPTTGSSAATTGSAATSTGTGTGGSRLDKISQREKEKEREREQREAAAKEALQQEEACLLEQLSLFHLPSSLSSSSSSSSSSCSSSSQLPIVTMIVEFLRVLDYTHALTLLTALSDLSQGKLTMDYLFLLYSDLREAWMALTITVVQQQLALAAGPSAAVAAAVSSHRYGYPLPNLASCSWQQGMEQILDDLVQPLSYHLAAACSSATTSTASRPSTAASILSNHSSGDIYDNSNNNNNNNVLYGLVVKVFICLIQQQQGQQGQQNNSQLFPRYVKILRLLFLSLSVSGLDSLYYSALLWRPLSLLPYEMRYRLYDAVKDLTPSTGTASSPTIAADTALLYYGIGPYLADKVNSRALRQELKRLAKDNIKKIGLALARSMGSSPMTGCRMMVVMAQSFDNLIPLMIEAMKHSATMLTKDLMAYSLLQELATREEERGASAAASSFSSSAGSYPLWFTALSKFIAQYYKRYMTTIGEYALPGLLGYLTASLADPKRGLQSDLLILKEVFVTIGGCDTLADLSVQQLEGLAGGAVLKSEVMYSILRSIGSNTITAGAAGAGTVAVAGNSTGTVNKGNISKKAAQVLYETLVIQQQQLSSSSSTTTSAAFPLLLFILRLRDSFLLAPHRQGGQPIEENIKAISTMYDTAQELLLQATDFLLGEPPLATATAAIASSTIATMPAAIKRFTILPTLPQLIEEYQLTLPAAFQISRPLLRRAWMMTMKQQPQHQLIAGTGGSSSLIESWYPFHPSILTCIRRQVANNWQLPSNGMEVAVESASSSLAATMVDDPLLRFFVLFWSLSLQYIYHPQERYAQEMKRISDKYAELDSKKTTGFPGAEAGSGGMISSIQQQSSPEYKKWLKAREQELQPLLVMIKELQEESGRQKKQVEEMKEQIVQTGCYAGPAAEGATAVVYLQSLMQLDRTAASNPAAMPTMTVTTRWLLQTCLAPRLLSSPLDAIYTMKYVKLLHDLSIPGIYLLEIYDSLLANLLPMLFAVTETEAGNLGLGIWEMFTQMNRWQTSFSLYDLEVRQKKISSLPSSLASGSAAASLQAHTSYTRYLDLYKRWHATIFTSLSFGLTSREFIYIRSALIFLGKVVSQWPTRKSDGLALIQLMEQLVQRETKEREDLAIMAKSVLVMVKKMMPSWVNDLPSQVSTASNAAIAAAGGSGNGNGSASKSMARVPSNRDLGAPTSGSRNSQAAVSGAGAGSSRKSSSDNLAAVAGSGSGGGNQRSNSRDRSGDNSHRGKADRDGRDRDSQDQRNDGRDRDRDRDRGSRDGYNSNSVAVAPPLPAASSSKQRDLSGQRGNGGTESGSMQQQLLQRQASNNSSNNSSNSRPPLPAGPPPVAPTLPPASNNTAGSAGGNSAAANKCKNPSSSSSSNEDRLSASASSTRGSDPFPPPSKLPRPNESSSNASNSSKAVAANNSNSRPPPPPLPASSGSGSGSGSGGSSTSRPPPPPLPNSSSHDHRGGGGGSKNSNNSNSSGRSQPQQQQQQSSSYNSSTGGNNNNNNNNNNNANNRDYAAPAAYNNSGRGGGGGEGDYHNSSNNYDSYRSSSGGGSGRQQQQQQLPPADHRPPPPPFPPQQQQQQQQSSSRYPDDRNHNSNNNNNSPPSSKRSRR